MKPRIGITLYTALLRSVMTYACPVWRHAAKQHNKLQILQNKVLRLATKLPRITPVRIIHRDTKMRTIQQYTDHLADEFYLSTENHANPLVARLGNYDPTPVSTKDQDHSLAHNFIRHISG